MVAISDNVKRLKLWSKYVQELDDISGARTTPLYQILENFDRTVKDPDTQWIDICSPSDGSLAGFFVVGTKTNCHPDADYYIQEAYVIPKYRRNGLMSSTVKEFVGSHEGIYCLFIINGNEIAKSFWGKVFFELGYEEIHLREVGAGDDLFTQYGFMKR